MKVKDIMNRKIITCQAGASISEASKLLRENKISGMPVMDGDEMVGIISESDILRLLSREDEGQLWLPSPFEIFEVPFRDIMKWEKMHANVEDISEKKISDFMKKDVRKISPEDSVEDAAWLMTHHRINRLPVVDGERLVGIVTRGDIIAGLGKHNEAA